VARECAFESQQRENLGNEQVRCVEGNASLRSWTRQNLESRTVLPRHGISCTSFRDCRNNACSCLRASMASFVYRPCLSGFFLSDVAHDRPATMQMQAIADDFVSNVFLLSLGTKMNRSTFTSGFAAAVLPRSVSGFRNWARYRRATVAIRDVVCGRRCPGPSLVRSQRKEPEYISLMPKRGKKHIKTVTYDGFKLVRGASAVRAILQHLPEKPSRWSVESHLSIAL
jgi:hypothetical protein